MNARIIFWGHDFFGNNRNKNDYQDRVLQVVDTYNRRNGTKYKPVFGDFPHYLKNPTIAMIKKQPIMKKYKPKIRKITPDAYLPKIISLIENSDIAVFDLNFRKKKHISLSLPINYNVLYELGIATGMKKKCYILCENNSIIDKHASDFSGIQKYLYNNYRSLDFDTAISNLFSDHFISRRIP